MKSPAVILHGAKSLSVAPVTLKAPTSTDLVVETRYSGVSSGTEKLFWSGDMPPFPGMGYPLVPGYETVGEVVEVGCDCQHKVGDMVFVPGAACYEDAHGLFGGSSRRIVTAADRVTPIDTSCSAEMTLLALAATARHSMAGLRHLMPELIVGHGVVGRLLAGLIADFGRQRAGGEVAALDHFIRQTRRYDHDEIGFGDNAGAGRERVDGHHDPARQIMMRENIINKAVRVTSDRHHQMQGLGIARQRHLAGGEGVICAHDQ